VTGIVRHAARVAVTAAIGVPLGLAVAASVVADGPRDARRVAIGALLLLYGLAGAALGFRAPAWYGLLLAVPGLAALVRFAVPGEAYGWYALYGALIVALAVGGASGGGALGRVRRGRSGGAAA
jgi:hypothetical protein